MVTAIRRLFWLASFGGVGYAGWSMMQRRSPATARAPATTPPATPSSTTPATSRPVTSAGIAPAITELHETALDTGLDDPVALWVAAIDGGCPDGYPVKANTNSGIYHVPGGRFYERTRAERCYAHTADAEA